MFWAIRSEPLIVGSSVKKSALMADFSENGFRSEGTERRKTWRKSSWSEANKSDEVFLPIAPLSTTKGGSI